MRFYVLVVTCLYLLFQSGFTFVAEVWKPQSLPADAKWKMVLIGTEEPLPKMSRETPLNAFSVKKFQEYYIPNKKNLICRCVSIINVKIHKVTLLLWNVLIAIFKIIGFYFDTKSTFSFLKLSCSSQSRNHGNSSISDIQVRCRDTPVHPGPR